MRSQWRPEHEGGNYALSRTPVTSEKNLTLHKNVNEIKAVTSVTPVTSESNQCLAENDLLQVIDSSPAVPTTAQTGARRSPDLPPKLLAASLVPDAAQAGLPDADADRWCWPHSLAMNSGELARLVTLTAEQQQCGHSPVDAEKLADTQIFSERLPAKVGMPLVALAKARSEKPQVGDAAWLKCEGTHRVYMAHHFNCLTCIAAGCGSQYVQRCGAGMALWAGYQDAPE